MRHWRCDDSSNVESVAYDEAGTLEIKFRGGGRYQYPHVPLPIIGKILTAESVGGAVHEYLVKPKVIKPTRLTERGVEDTLDAHPDRLQQCVAALQLIASVPAHRDSDDEERDVSDEMRSVARGTLGDSAPRRPTYYDLLTLAERVRDNEGAQDADCSCGPLYAHAREVLK